MPTVAGNAISDAAFHAGKILAAAKGVSMKQFTTEFKKLGHDRVEALLALNNLLDIGLAAQVDETFYIVDAYAHEFIDKPKAKAANHHGKSTHKK